MTWTFSVEYDDEIDSIRLPGSAMQHRCRFPLAKLCSFGKRIVQGGLRLTRLRYGVIERLDSLALLAEVSLPRILTSVLQAFRRDIRLLSITTCFTRLSFSRPTTND
jgi:hypothetical protein